MSLSLRLLKFIWNCGRHIDIQMIIQSAGSISLLGISPAIQSVFIENKLPEFDCTSLMLNKISINTNMVKANSDKLFPVHDDAHLWFSL